MGAKKASVKQGGEVVEGVINADEVLESTDQVMQWMFEKGPSKKAPPDVDAVMALPSVQAALKDVVKSILEQYFQGE